MYINIQTTERSAQTVQKKISTAFCVYQNTSHREDEKKSQINAKKKKGQQLATITPKALARENEIAASLMNELAFSLAS